jgi:hypothetical protein
MVQIKATQPVTEPRAVAAGCYHSNRTTVPGSLGSEGSLVVNMEHDPTSGLRIGSN